MADLTDKASDYEEIEREACISSARVAARRAQLPAIGQCYNCGEATEGNTRFCDAECRDRYEFEKRMRAINGRR